MYLILNYMAFLFKHAMSLPDKFSFASGAMLCAKFDLYVLSLVEKLQFPGTRRRGRPEGDLS